MVMSLWPTFLAYHVYNAKSKKNQNTFFVINSLEKMHFKMSFKCGKVCESQVILSREFQREIKYQCSKLTNAVHKQILNCLCYDCKFETLAAWQVRHPGCWKSIVFLIKTWRNAWKVGWLDKYTKGEVIYAVTLIALVW